MPRAPPVTTTTDPAPRSRSSLIPASMPASESSGRTAVASVRRPPAVRPTSVRCVAVRQLGEQVSGHDVGALGRIDVDQPSLDVGELAGERADHALRGRRQHVAVGVAGRTVVPEGAALPGDDHEPPDARLRRGPQPLELPDHGGARVDGRRERTEVDQRVRPAGDGGHRVGRAGEGRARAGVRQAIAQSHRQLGAVRRAAVRPRVDAGVDHDDADAREVELGGRPTPAGPRGRGPSAPAATAPGRRQAGRPPPSRPPPRSGRPARRAPPRPRWPRRPQPMRPRGCRPGRGHGAPRPSRRCPAGS